MHHADHHDDGRLLTAGELAEYLGIPLRTIYTWRYQGTAPPAVRLGRHLRFRWRDVQAWLDERTR